MKALPILMSAPMVRALLAGTKTQTRRVIKPQPECGFIVGITGSPACPYGLVGDFLWVRETFAEVGNLDPPWVLYRASGYENECKRHGFDNPPPESQQAWRPSIFMPRRLSRLTLRITNVRVQRLHVISEADCIAGGCRAVSLHDLDCDSPAPSAAYRKLWESINGAGSWAANPFVWALNFTVRQKNVDEVLSEVE